MDRSVSLAPVLRGWRYSLLLAVSGAVLLVSGVLIGMLVVEALRHPTTLGQWSFDLSGSRQVLVLLSLAVGLLALRLLEHLQPVDQQLHLRGVGMNGNAS